MKTKIIDILGASAAIICLIHCVAFPLLMIVPLGISHNAYIDLFFFIIGTAIVFRITKKQKTVGFVCCFGLPLLQSVFPLVLI